MHEALRAGIAIYNDGFYHAAHDAWEATWLSLEDGTDDERLLHGLIQFTAAVHHARNRNWEGATGLADSAGTYLARLPDPYRGVALEPVRQFLAELAADPEVIERHEPLSLTHDGTRLTCADLSVTEIAIVAPILGEEWGYDGAPLEGAAKYAITDLEGGDDGSRFISLLFDFVLDEAHRGVIYQRLSQHVSRRTARESDVEGLF